MFDLRYHVASLAAVFLALIIGILVGVGISDRGLVDTAKRNLLEHEVANLQKRLDNQATQATDQVRQQQAAQAFVNGTYPTLVHNRLKNKQVAVVFVGSADQGLRSVVGQTLAESGAQQLRLRALKVPFDVRQIEAALKNQPAAAGLRGTVNLEPLGQAVGQELASGGDTPLWNSLTEALAEEQVGGSKAPADGVVVVRSAKPQNGPAARFVLGIYEGLASANVPAVGVEQTDTKPSATGAFRQAGLSSVDDIDTKVGRLALVWLLKGASPGQYGVKQSAGDGELPPMPTGG